MFAKGTPVILVATDGQNFITQRVHEGWKKGAVESAIRNLPEGVRLTAIVTSDKQADALYKTFVENRPVTIGDVFDALDTYDYDCL